MSYVEVNQPGGMPFGGMPHDSILYKLEVTDADMVDEVRGTDAFHDTADDYDLYARGEIIDRTPDKPYLESDHQRRDPATSRTMLNLRHSGGRGPNDYRLPQHPEMFIGFTGNDPRGRDTQPRMDKARAQTAARGRNLAVRMGHNVGHGGLIVADRPWTGPSIEYSKMEGLRRSKKRMNWFAIQKVGRPWGRNNVTDRYYGLKERAAVIAGGGEGIFVPEQDQPRTGWFQAGGDAPVRGATDGGVRRVDRRRDAETAPWRNTASDADLQVARHGENARRGRTHVSPDSMGGGRAAAARADQTFGAASKAAATNRKAIAETMATSAGRHRKLVESAKGDIDHQRSVERARMGVGAVPGNHAAAHQSAHTDHTAPANAEITEVARAMARGLREGGAAGRRTAQGQAVATGRLGNAAVASLAPGGGIAPGGDLGAAAWSSSAPMTRAAAAGLTVAHYGGPRRPVAQESAALAWLSGVASAGQGRVAPRSGRTKRPEFQSHTQSPATLGASPAQVFGVDTAASTTGGLSIGRKDVRADSLRDKGDDDVLLDGLGLESQAI